MAEGQKNRRLGVGMKPRGKAGVKAQKEAAGVEQSPIVGGHGEEPEKADFEPEAPAERGEDLEPENEPISEQNSDSTVADQSREDLLKTMEENGNLKEIEINGNKYFIGIDASSSDDLTVMAAQMDDQAVRLIHGDIGPQPDGSLAVRVIIDEPHVTIVTDSATDMEQTPSQWVTDRFREWLESYYTLPGKR